MSLPSLRPSAQIIVFGCGGHGRVVGDALAQMIANDRKTATFVGWLDDAEQPVTMAGRPVLGSRQEIATLQQTKAICSFVMGIGAVRGGRTTRHILFDELVDADLEPVSVCHPSSIIAPDVEIGAGSVVLPAAVLNVGTAIGSNVIINTRASLDHDVVVGEGSHIAPGVTISGDVLIGRYVHIGTGASISNGISIGDGATIGVGAAVVNDIAPGETVMGVPARGRMG